MAEFTPSVAILPGHPVYPNSLKLHEVAAALHDLTGVTARVPSIPPELTRSPLTTAVWAESTGFPGTQEHIAGMNQLRRNLEGANALLIVNQGNQHIYTDGGTGVIWNSVSDRISTVAAFEWGEDGVPVALTNQFTHEGGDTPLAELATRMAAIEGLGATVVGVDLAGMPDFLASRVRPEFAVGPVV